MKMSIDKKTLTQLWDYFYGEKLKLVNSFFKIRSEKYYQKEKMYNYFLDEINKALTLEVKKPRRKTLTSLLK